VAQALAALHQEQQQEQQEQQQQQEQLQKKKEEEKDEEEAEYVVVRLKNRFKTPLFNGYRDALYNIVVKCGNGVTHVCEVQLHLADIVAHKERSHVFYEYFRAYFSGSGAEESRMKALIQIFEGQTAEGRPPAEGFSNVEHMIGSILRGNDIEKLQNLAYLVQDLMGDVQVALLIRKRILDLDQHSLVEKGLYGRALLAAGKLKEAERMLRQALDETRQQLGSSHPDTLTSITDLALLLEAQGKLAEAEPLLREALHGTRQQLGNLHPNTLTSINNLGMLLKDQGKLAEPSPCIGRHWMGAGSNWATCTPTPYLRLMGLACCSNQAGST